MTTEMFTGPAGWSTDIRDQWVPDVTERQSAYLTTQPVH